jgi:hypothetical protein
MNWGHKLTLVFIAFAAFMIYMVVRSFQANVDLVTEDYYLEEINYQEKIDKISNVKRFDKAVDYRLTMEGVELTFPENSANGTVHLYRPSEADQDKKYDLIVDEHNRFLIGIKDLRPGKFRIKLDWSDGAVPYYQEIEVLIPGS